MKEKIPNDNSLVFKKIPFIRRPIRPSVHSPAVELVIHELAGIECAAVVGQLADAVHLVVGPFAVVDAAFGGRVDAAAAADNATICLDILALCWQNLEKLFIKKISVL